MRGGVEVESTPKLYLSLMSVPVSHLQPENVPIFEVRLETVQKWFGSSFFSQARHPERYGFPSKSDGLWYCGFLEVRFIQKDIGVCRREQRLDVFRSCVGKIYCQRCTPELGKRQNAKSNVRGTHPSTTFRMNVLTASLLKLTLGEHAQSRCSRLHLGSAVALRYLR